MVSYISLFFLLLLSSCLFIRSLGQKTFILGPRMQLKKLTVSINYIFIVSHLIYGFSWWFPVFIASHYISEVSTQEYRFSSKTASQFTSLACCRYVQKICAAKMSEVAHVSWTSSFQACRYIKKTWGKKPCSSISLALWNTAVILHSSQPHPEQQFSCQGVSHYPHINCLETSGVFHALGWVGFWPTPQQFFCLPACPRWGGRSFQRSSIKYEYWERF